MDVITHELIAMVKHFKGVMHPMLLDVGCGVGNVVTLAYAAGFNAFGVEYDEKMMPYALCEHIPMSDVENKIEPPFRYNGQQKTLTLLKLEYAQVHKRIILGNAFDFKGYDKFDVIYYYCPLHDRKEEKKLELLIENRCKVGCVLLCNLKQSDRIDQDKRFKHLDGPMWEKISK